MFRKHFVKILIGCFISVLLIWLTFKNINFSETVLALKTAKYALLIPAVLIYAFTYVLRAIRYYFMLSPVKKTRLLENFPYTMTGYFMNNVIPLRIGELIRAKITGERLAVSRSSVLATIVLERLFDIIAFIAMFFVITFMASTIHKVFPEEVKTVVYICSAIAAIMLVVLAITMTHTEKTVKLISIIPAPAKIKTLLLDLFNKFAGGLSMLKSPKIITVALGLSFAVWITESLSLVIVALSLGINLSVMGAVFTVIIIGIGAIIPTGPGFIGAFEYFGARLALPALGVAAVPALACILLYHFMQLVVIAGLGAGSVIKSKISFSDLFKFAKIEDNKRDEI